MIEKIIDLKSEIRNKRPLVHCITNPISINQCANAVLAVGASPIMAEHPSEVSEITSGASALVVNLGNITDVRMESMRLSAAAAKQKGIPVVLDLVGIACSGLRRNFAKELTSDFSPELIKGNYSEILALFSGEGSASGVDADTTLNTEFIEEISVSLSVSAGTVVLASGSTDIVASGRDVCRIHNGTPQLASITGTGCMLGALCGCYFSVKNSSLSAAAACVHMALSGELSVTERGVASFMVNLIDRLSLLSDEDIINNIRLEEIKK